MFVVVLLCVFQLCAAGKVLVVFPVPSYSHALFGDSVVNILIKGGHEVPNND